MRTYFYWSELRATDSTMCLGSSYMIMTQRTFAEYPRRGAHGAGRVLGAVNISPCARARGHKMRPRRTRGEPAARAASAHMR